MINLLFCISLIAFGITFVIETIDEIKFTKYLSNKN